MKVFFTPISIALCLLFSACSSKPESAKMMDCLPPIYPDYTDVTIPVGIAPLNFNVVAGDDVERVDVIVKGSKGGEIHTNGAWAKFDIDEWHNIVEQNQGEELSFTVCAMTQGEWRQYQDFKVFVSSCPLEEWGLTYRRIAPGYEIYSHLGIYQRDLSNFEEYTILDNAGELGDQCLNCHAANKTSPKQFVFHVRGAHGATMVQQSGKREWLKTSNDILGGSMVYPYWHPSGNYCAFSTNKTQQAFHVMHQNRIEVFDMSSDVFVYNPATHEILTDSLLSTPDWSENCPVFSPDGRKLYFITCKQQEYPLHYQDEKYNLCCIDFNPEDGTYGNKADTLFNAVAMGKSLTWPKPSYDGKFLMFTLLDYGYFSIWHKESEQWIMNLETGESRPMDEINSDDADSYHNWSANSHWIVFTSRRDNGLYSQLFLASVDENGMATKPFLLPQENPQEYYDETLYSFNTPDFTLEKVSFDNKSAIKEIRSDKRTATSVR